MRKQIIFYLVLFVICMSSVADISAIEAEKIQGEKLSSKNLGEILTPRGRHGQRGSRGQHGHRGSRGKAGATGATGATGTEFAHIYGSASRAATDVTSNPTDVIPFEVTGLLNGVTFAGNTFTIQTAGVYRVAYVIYMRRLLGTPEVALNLVGSGVIANTARRMIIAVGESLPFAFSGNLSFNAGDQIQVINNGAATFFLPLESPGSAFTVIKVGEL